MQEDENKESDDMAVLERECVMNVIKQNKKNISEKNSDAIKAMLRFNRKYSKMLKSLAK